MATNSYYIVVRDTETIEKLFSNTYIYGEKLKIYLIIMPLM